MGAILIHPKDKQAIYKYLKDMDVEMNGFLHRQMDDVESDDATKVMNRISRELQSNKFPFEVEYIFSLNKAKGYYDKDKNKITIVYSWFSDWRFAVKEDGYVYKHVYNVNSVDFDKMADTFIHEFVHFIQHQLRMAKTGEDYILPGNYLQNYYKQGWERQAHAIGYLEKLKRDMKIKKPEAILSQLRKMGVLHNDDLNKLKQTDYKSWKAIMKQAIMATIADIEDRKAMAT